MFASLRQTENSCVCVFLRCRFMCFFLLSLSLFSSFSFLNVCLLVRRGYGVGVKRQTVWWHACIVRNVHANSSKLACRHQTPILLFAPIIREIAFFKLLKTHHTSWITKSICFYEIYTSYLSLTKRNQARTLIWFWREREKIIETIWNKSSALKKTITKGK